MDFRPLLLVSTLAAASMPALGQGDPATIAKVVDEAKHRSKAVSNFRFLTKKIGARRTGSQAITKASEWAVSQFKSYGLSNVQLEKYGDVPIGFERGKQYSGKMILPFESSFVISSPAWSPGTNGPLQGEAVFEPRTLAELEQIKDGLGGKWVLVRGSVSMGGRRRNQMTEEERKADPAGAEREAIEKAVEEAGIAGRVMRDDSPLDLVHTHGSWQGLTWDNLPRNRRVIVRGSDFRRVERALIAKERVVLEFNLDQKFLKQPVPLYNVVAEIPGAEKPDEMVVVGAHLDSWDGPGSEGASDNGTGSITTLEAARLLMAAGAKPKRTIRFVLFSGEEQGLYGSIAHVRMLGERVNKISAMFCEDSGSNRHASVTGLPIWEPYLTQAVSDYNKAFPEAPIKVNVTERFGRGGGSDHASFMQRGVPSFFWGKAGPQNYMRIWHTNIDTFEEAIPDNVRQMSVNTALAAYNIACADRLLPRPTAP